MVDGEPRKATALGVGPVDAIFKAIAELIETKSSLERYQVHAITGGIDALGEVSVTVSEEGRKVIGNGADPDVMVASASAYVHALNKLEWHKRRRHRLRAEGHLEESSGWSAFVVLPGDGIGPEVTARGAPGTGSGRQARRHRPRRSRRP